VAVLYLVGCAAYPARDLPDLVGFCQRLGWHVCVVCTPSGRRFADPDRLRELTGHRVRSDYKAPDAPDELPPADAFVVAPATFNTINKWAHGSSDTLALGLLNEAVGLGRPIIAAPWPNRALARHPVFGASVRELRGWGVQVIFDPDRQPIPGSGAGTPAVFPWAAVRDAVRAWGPPGG
jgi:phosphopantothenoylcysteine synthetase/decarboxylase